MSHNKKLLPTEMFIGEFHVIKKNKYLNMKQLIFILTFVITITICNAQRIVKITITNAGITESLSVGLDENVVVNVSPNGDLINYGIEYTSERIANYTRVENYNGRTEMYSAYEDKAFQGKVKYIGITAITYYASYDIELLRGKIKSIGNINFEYYMPYEDEILRGKIKIIGSNTIAYYNSFDNAALKGKIRSVGATALNYYSSFDDKATRGRIKSIGSVSFTYYSSFETQYAGAMKTGNMQQNINGINFYIR